MARRYPNWEDPSKFLLDPIVEQESEDEVELLAMVRNGNVQSPEMSRVRNEVRGLIETSATQLEDLKRNLKGFLEEHLQDFAGDIAQKMLLYGFVNSDNLCSEQTARLLFRKLDDIDEKMNNLQAKRESSVSSVVVGEISKNLKEINDKVDRINDAIMPIVAKQAEEHERADYLEEAMEVMKENIELTQYVTSVKQDKNTVAFKTKIEEVALAIRKGFKILRDSIPQLADSKVDVEQQPRLDAIWATIDHSLSQMCKLAMVCPVGDPILDEKMVAQTGLCREDSTYERVSKNRLEMALELLEDHPLMVKRTLQQSHSQKMVRFVPNIANPKIKKVMASTSKMLASTPGSSAQKSSFQQSSFQQPATQQAPTLQDSAATYQPLPPSPPVSWPYGNLALRAAFPKGIIKEEKFD